MGFQKGHTKLGGRQAGSENKITQSVRNSINAFLEDNFEEVKAEWKKLKGRDKLNFWRDLLKYSVPALQSIEVQSDLERLTDSQLEQLYNDLKAEMLANLNKDEREEE